MILLIDDKSSHSCCGLHLQAFSQISIQYFVLPPMSKIHLEEMELIQLLLQVFDWGVAHKFSVL